MPAQKQVKQSSSDMGAGENTLNVDEKGTLTKSLQYRFGELRDAEGMSSCGTRV